MLVTRANSEAGWQFEFPLLDTDRLPLGITVIHPFGAGGARATVLALH
jgi:hypothetical protein